MPTGRVYGHAWRRLRRHVIDRETHCALCGQAVDKTLRYPHPHSPSVDHRTPLEAGGQMLDPGNVRLSHLRCNQSAGATYGNGKCQHSFNVSNPLRGW